MVPIIDSKCGLVGDTVIVPRRVVLLMVQKSGEKTTWDVYNLVNNWIWTTNLNRWSSRFLVAINSMYSFWRIKALQVGIQEYVCVYIFFLIFLVPHIDLFDFLYIKCSPCMYIVLLFVDWGGCTQFFVKLLPTQQCDHSVQPFQKNMREGKQILLGLLFPAPSVWCEHFIPKRCADLSSVRNPCWLGCKGIIQPSYIRIIISH